MHAPELDTEPDSAPRERRGCLGVALAVGGSFLVLLAGALALLAWIRTVTPSTSVHVGGQVPVEYAQTLRDLGALEPDEELVCFYSDAVLRIEEGCYFVSDRKVGVYHELEAPPLVSVPFEEIAEARLERDVSVLTDSHITLVLRDGSEVWLPVSSEEDGDVRFHRAIVERLTR
ncbi:MAG: hypothetical protein H6828_06575 [Planctomycetes bacterium]|nr:hypothetical protein [Planctomycetota bacterium]